MPHWYLWVEEDSGSAEWMIVQAENATTALDSVGVDIAHVRILKAHGNVRGSVVRGLASVCFAIYFLIVGNAFVGWNWQALTALGVAGTIAYLGVRVVAARRRSRIGSEHLIHRRKVSNQMRTNVQALKWIILMVALGLGISVVVSLGGDDVVKPADVALPFILFGFVWLNQSDLL